MHGSGLVETTRDIADRRVWQVELTSGGRKKANRVRKVFRDKAAALTKHTKMPNLVSGIEALKSLQHKALERKTVRTIE